MSDRVAAATVVALGALWGLYWLPLRQLDAVATAGPWATFAAVAVACLVLAPFGWFGRGRLRAANARSLWSIGLGGAAFVLYSNALLYGQVATVILLFYLTPIWSTLIARFWLGWPIAGWRYAAIVLGLAGTALIFGADGGIPLPRTLGDWLGLLSGMLWSVAATGIRVHVRTRPAETNFVFCVGGLVMAAALLPLAASAPPSLAVADIPAAVGWTVLIGGGWWGASLVAFMWASKRLEPARVGILLMAEVVVGSISAALLTAEPFGVLMAVGAMLVISAGILETLPDRRRASAAHLNPDPPFTRADRRPAMTGRFRFGRGDWAGRGATVCSKDAAREPTWMYSRRVAPRPAQSPLDQRQIDRVRRRARTAAKPGHDRRFQRPRCSLTRRRPSSACSSVISASTLSRAVEALSRKWLASKWSTASVSQR